MADLSLGVAMARRDALPCAGHSLTAFARLLCRVRPPLRPPCWTDSLPMQGKSTLANRLLGHERSLTGPEPGLTRDAVHDSFEWGGQRVQLVDTAGWMRRTRLPNYDDSG